MHSFPFVHLLIPGAVGEHILTGRSSLLLNPNALPSSTGVPQAEITFLFREVRVTQNHRAQGSSERHCHGAGGNGSWSKGRPGWDTDRAEDGIFLRALLLTSVDKRLIFTQYAND